MDLEIHHPAPAERLPLECSLRPPAAANMLGSFCKIGGLEPTAARRRDPLTLKFPAQS